MLLTKDDTGGKGIVDPDQDIDYKESGIPRVIDFVRPATAFGKWWERELDQFSADSILKGAIVLAVETFVLGGAIIGLLVGLIGFYFGFDAYMPVILALIGGVTGALTLIDIVESRKKEFFDYFWVGAQEGQIAVGMNTVNGYFHLFGGGESIKKPWVIFRRYVSTMPIKLNGKSSYTTDGGPTIEAEWEVICYINLNQIALALRTTKEALEKGTVEQINNLNTKILSAFNEDKPEDGDKEDKTPKISDDPSDILEDPEVVRKFSTTAAAIQRDFDISIQGSKWVRSTKEDGGWKKADKVNNETPFEKQYAISVVSATIHPKLDPQTELDRKIRASARRLMDQGKFDDPVKALHEAQVNFGVASRDARDVTTRMEITGEGAEGAIQVFGSLLSNIGANVEKREAPALKSEPKKDSKGSPDKSGGRKRR